MEIFDYSSESENISKKLQELTYKTISKGEPFIDFMKFAYELIDNSNTYTELFHYKDIIISNLPTKEWLNYENIRNFDNSFLVRNNITIEDLFYKNEILLDYYLSNNFNLFTDTILKDRLNESLNKYLLDESYSLDENKEKFKSFLRDFESFTQIKHESIACNNKKLFIDRRINIRKYSSRIIFRKSEDDNSSLVKAEFIAKNFILTKDNYNEKYNIKRNRSLIVT